jgi:hypothetical protein
VNCVAARWMIYCIAPSTRLPLTAIRTFSVPAMLRDQVKAVVKPWRLEDVLASVRAEGMSVAQVPFYGGSRKWQFNPEVPTEV